MIFLVLYGLTALINISSIHNERRIVRSVSKICLMPILVLFYVFKSNDFSFVIVSAMVLSWCGDILLIEPKKPGIYIGILSFFAAHILYILAFIDLAGKIDSISLIVSYLFVLSIEWFLLKKLHIQNKYKVFLIAYGIAIGLLVVFSVQVFIRHKNTPDILLVIGSVSFFISDAVLAYFNTVKSMTKKSLTIVMLSYTIAQACIIIGLVR